jgi:hypothetical protein
MIVQGNLKKSTRRSSCLFSWLLQVFTLSCISRIHCTPLNCLLLANLTQFEKTSLICWITGVYQKVLEFRLNWRFTSTSDYFSHSVIYHRIWGWFKQQLICTAKVVNHLCLASIIDSPFIQNQYRCKWTKLPFFKNTSSGAVIS